jgi:hypothetical protein
MFDCTGPTTESAPDAAFIRLDVGHPHWSRAARLLEAVGGRRYQPAAGTVYRFLTKPARDRALALVRGAIGHGVATGHDACPGSVHGSRAAPPSRRTWAAT